MIMMQAASLGSAVTVEVAFLTPSLSSDLRSQALPFGEDDRCLEIRRGWLFRVYNFDPSFHGVGPGFWQLGLLGTIFLPIFTSLAGYSAMGTVNPGDVGVLLDKPMETGPVESTRRVP
ncbi:hypothetical protein L3X38_018870 [Prunus dulcis]|uniref:Uncharacterized protein n=1 Tax=Prunus dulcis TaxID=3755 RepID=A0AAD4WAU3_PRUDU|nr:hypothetical protein L3X38_018870 [Prunus dulcis]